MTKKIMLFTLLIVFFILPDSLGAQKKFSFFINGGLTGPIKVTNSGFAWEWGYDDVNIFEECIIDPFSTLEGNFSFSGGFSYQFSRNFGIEVSAAYIKQNLYIDSEYYVEISTVNDSVEFDTFWENDGSRLEIVPLSLNLVYKTRIGRDLYSNLKAGITVFFTRVNLFSNIGWADILDDEQFYYPDWYDLEVDIIRRDTIIGFNIGLDLEKRIGRNLSIYMGFEYFYAPAKQYYWEVYWEQGMEVLGELENLILVEAPDIHADRAVTSDLRISFYRAYGGIKIFL